MVKYIDKGTALKHLTDMLMKTAVNGTGVEVDAGELLRYIAEDRLPVWIDDLQIYELEEVMRGRWIVAETEYAWNCAEYPASYKCSKCGYIAKAGLEDNYCPHCGAKMDKEE